MFAHFAVHSRDDVIGKVSISKELLTAKPQGKRQYFLESIHLHPLFTRCGEMGNQYPEPTRHFSVSTRLRLQDECCKKVVTNNQVRPLVICS